LLVAKVIVAIETLQALSQIRGDRITFPAKTRVRLADYPKHLSQSVGLFG